MAGGEQIPKLGSWRWDRSFSKWIIVMHTKNTPMRASLKFWKLTRFKAQGADACCPQREARESCTDEESSFIALLLEWHEMAAHNI